MIHEALIAIAIPEERYCSPKTINVDFGESYSTTCFLGPYSPPVLELLSPYNFGVCAERFRITKSPFEQFEIQYGCDGNRQAITPHSVAKMFLNISFSSGVNQFRVKGYKRFDEYNKLIDEGGVTEPHIYTAKSFTQNISQLERTLAEIPTANYLRYSNEKYKASTPRQSVSERLQRMVEDMVQICDMQVYITENGELFAFHPALLPYDACLFGYMKSGICENRDLLEGINMAGVQFSPSCNF